MDNQHAKEQKNFIIIFKIYLFLKTHITVVNHVNSRGTPGIVNACGIICNCVFGGGSNVPADVGGLIGGG